ncbi:hypothetical protein P7M47_01370 [Bisgaard Taxon 10/6]|uniref:hypothetical protein n=1 Tax=Exercitatus varius TaxID=67857 RepID=UPI00294B509C|nr:hypothetical protein [Exercitatus varius]MDG2914637.1 hypothetical protein [Exercitatus varius]MDG2944473.1 hypothetical protein [Exercitatus varius]MDG2962840.1 hypothetical protein [Exercitatus varius]MDG2963621.1 hypothetical protein [Exercitatus varius]
MTELKLKSLFASVFPNQPAAEIAVRTVKAFLADNPQMKVVFNVFKDVDWEIYRALLG